MIGHDPQQAVGLCRSDSSRYDFEAPDNIPLARHSCLQILTFYFATSHTAPANSQDSDASTNIHYPYNSDKEKTIVIGWEEISRRYLWDELSWLYDIDFEILDQDNIDKIFCIGRFRYDVYARLVLAGIKEDKLIMVDNIGDITKLLKVSKGKIFTMVCFDMTAILKKLFMEDNND